MFRIAMRSFQCLLIFFKFYYFYKYASMTQILLLDLFFVFNYLSLNSNIAHPLQRHARQLLYIRVVPTRPLFLTIMFKIPIIDSKFIER